VRMKIITLWLLALSSICLAAPLFNSFNGGELDPLLKYRVDLQRRYMGMEEMENMVVKIPGAAFRRPGTEYINDVNDHNESTRLIPFEYSTTDAYILVFNGGYISFYRTVPD